MNRSFKTSGLKLTLAALFLTLALAACSERPGEAGGQDFKPTIEHVGTLTKFEDEISSLAAYKERGFVAMDTRARFHQVGENDRGELVDLIKTLDQVSAGYPRMAADDHQGEWHAVIASGGSSVFIYHLSNDPPMYEGYIHVEPHLSNITAIRFDAGVVRFAGAGGILIQAATDESFLKADSLKGSFRGALIQDFHSNNTISVLATTSGVVAFSGNGKQVSTPINDGLSIDMPSTGNRFYLATSRGRVLEMEVAADTIVTKRELTIGNSTQRVWQIALHPSEPFMLCALESGPVMLDLGSGEKYPASNFQGRATRCAISRDGNLFAVNGGEYSHVLYVYDISSFSLNIGKVRSSILGL